MAEDDDPIRDELFDRKFALEDAWTQLEMTLESGRIPEAAEDATYLAVECGRFVRFVESVERAAEER